MPITGAQQSYETIYCSGVRQALNGTTTKTALATVFIPAGKMGPNSSMEIEVAFSVTANTNIKTTDVSIGPNPASVASLWSRNNNAAATIAQVPKIVLTNRGLYNSQIIPYDGNSSYGTNVTAAFPTKTIDFAVDQNIYIFGTLANSADFIYLDSLVVVIRNAGR